MIISVFQAKLELQYLISFPVFDNRKLGTNPLKKGCPSSRLGISKL